PTAGGAVGDAAAWCFDGAVLEEKLRVTLRRFWASKPSVIFSDIGSLHFNSPKDVEHFHRALHSLRGNEPRGVWDLLAIIGDMMRRQDNNGVLLLEIVTRCIIDMRELMSLWCFAQMKPYLLLKGLPRQTQYAALWLCEETVQLWRLACLNPDLRPQIGLVSGRVPSGSSAISACSNASGSNTVSGCWLLQQLTRRLKAFHLFALEQAGYRIPAVNMDSDQLSSESSPSIASGANGGSSEDFQRFIGFKPALAACCLNWPLDMPPTHAFSIAEFRSCMPTFLGARPAAPSEELLGTVCNSTISSYAKWMRTIRPLKQLRLDVDPVSGDSPDPPSAQLFADLPKPCNDVELAFARFQALDVHGHMEQSLIWARYLACHLLHTSRDFVANLETVAFDVVGSSQLPGCTGSSLFGSPLEHESSVETGTDLLFSRSHDTVARRQRKVVMKAPISGLSVPHAGPEINGGARGKRQNVTTIMPDESSASGDGIYNKAITWASKVSNLLDQIRCLMECLTRGYNEFVFSSTNVTSANRITSNGRTLLTYRGPDPTFVSFHLDDTASPVAQQTLRSNMLSIKDEWTCLDIELAFRLGFYGLTLPRPPTLSPTLEVRLFDQEVALVSRLCRLPLHLACPHVVQNIRHEATLLARGLSAYQTDILVPYNLLTYVFHQLVGIYPTSEVLSNLSNPDNLSGSRDPSENDTNSANFLAARTRPGISEGADPSEHEARPVWTNGTSESDGISHCPVLSTGIILAGSGFPLAFSVHQGRRAGTDFGAKKCQSRVTDMVALRDIVMSDADLGFTAALSVIGTRSRVPQSTHPYFIEGQWAQLDALMVYLLRHYRDDIAKLDRLLIHLLDRFYNPHFKSPPLWACLSLPPRDLMRYDAADTNGDNACESSADTVANFINPIVNVPKSPNMAGVCTSLDFSESGFVPALVATCSNIEPIRPVLVHSKSTPMEELQLSSTDVNILTEERNDAFSTLDVRDKVASDIAPTELSPDAEGVISGSCVEPPASLSRPSSPEKYSIVNEPRMYEPLSASEDTDTLSDSKRWSAAFRCATLGDPLKRGRHSVGMAAVDTSAPETTSSDNSPAACRRLFLFERCETNRLTGVQDARSNLPGDLLQSSSSIPNTNATPTPGIELKKARSKLPDVSVPSFIRTSRRRVGHMMRSSLSSFSSFSEDDDPIPARVDYTADEGQPLESTSAGFPLVQLEVACEQPSCDLSTNSVSASLPVERDFTSEPPPKNRNDPSDTGVWPPHLKRPPPQPLSESIAFHFFYLAKSVRKLAGGPSASGSVFVAEPEVNGTVHRNLQLVAFQIGLYGLGLYNRPSPSWKSRTYSPLGVWVSQQVFELGIPAACILYQTWQEHLTAAELAGIAFQLSRENNRALVDIAVELCLASLTFCTTLRPHEIYRALGQCEEHSTLALERGLLQIENSDNQSAYGILPEIYFSLARSWFSLHQTTLEQYKKALEASREQMREAATETPEQPSSLTSANRPTTDSASCNSMSHPADVSVNPLPTGLPVAQNSGLDQGLPQPSSWSVGPADSAHPSHTSVNMFPSPDSGLYLHPRLQATYQHMPDPSLTMISSGSSVYPPVFYYPPNAEFAFRPNTVGGLSVPGGPLLSAPPQMSMIPPNFLPPTGFIPSNSPAFPPVVQAPGAQYRSHLHSTPSAMTQPMHAFNLYFQPHSDPTMSNLSQPIYTSHAPVISAAQSAVVDGPFPVAAPTYAVPFTPNLTQLSLARLAANMGTPQPNALTPRLNPMSNASSSVVVHPASSDRGSITSETDSSRPIELQAEGPLLEDPGVASGDSSVASNTSAIEALRLKSTSYLRRAYLCATNAIKKSFLPQASTHASVSTPSVPHISTISSGRTGRGIRHHHHHHYHHHHSGQLQRPKLRLNNPQTVASSVNGPTASDVESTSGIMSNGTSQSNTPCDLGHLLIPVTSETQLLKVSDNNILWTLDVASGLGPPVVHEYCNLVLQCVQSPLLLKEITTKVIDYFRQLSSQRGTQTNQTLTNSTMELPVHLGPSGHQIVPSTPHNPSLANAVTNGFFTGPPLKQLGQQSQVTTSHPPQLYIPHYGTYPVLGPTNTGNNHNWHQPPRCLWPLQPTPQTLDNMSQYAAMTYSNPFPFSPMLTQSFGSISSVTPQQSPQTQNQLVDMLSRFQFLGLHQEPPPQQSSHPFEGRLSCLSAQSAAHPSPIYQSSTSDWYLAHGSSSARPAGSCSTNPSTVSPPNASRIAQLDGGDPQLTGELDLIERLINRTHSLFHKFIDQRLQYIGQAQADWDDFVDVILKAYTVHLSMPATDCRLRWNVLLTRIRRHHKCTAALWQRILAGIKTADLNRSA
ncbi:hypothetical protein PHET_05329, partial [Paragonimus heterotremus]